jgi:trk system potassium uptake protein TrkH
MTGPLRGYRAGLRHAREWSTRCGLLVQRALDVLRRWARFVAHKLSGPQLLVVSFAALILAGALGLKFLPGLYTAPGLGWLDALFTATSAVCVTGLIVVDTATYFTPAGQLFILLLIQLGGLGMITLSTAIILALGGRPTLGHEEVSAPGAELAPGIDLRRLSRHVVVFTCVFELAGAVLLTALWAPRFGLADAAWHGLFQSVSAFCNAGFSTFSDSLTSFSHSVPSVLVASLLIIAGGLGFLTIEELYVARRGGRQARTTLHTKLVLSTTVVLLLVGWLLYAVLEWHGVLADMTWPHRLSNSLFMSVTARTAGFNTVDYSTVSAGGNFLTILLMMVGGSPGSTAGGLKTTTLALVVLLAWARVKGYRSPQAFYRSIPEETVQRAVGLVVVVSFVVGIAIFVFAAVEVGGPGSPAQELEFLRYAFEAVSAFNTVGLSMGVTSSLDPIGRLVTILVMFLGRVGPLTFTAAIARRARHRGLPARFAKEDVVVG